MCCAALVRHIRSAGSHIRSAALVSPVAERYGHSGTNPAKGHNAAEGLEPLTQEGRLRHLGLFIFNLEKAQGRPYELCVSEDISRWSQSLLSDA